jgi:hypothetical protein
VTPIIVQDAPFWSMVSRLRQFEGWRCLWRLPVAAFFYALPALTIVGATVLAAFIAGDGFDFRSAAIAAIVGAGATAFLAPRLAGRRLHRKIVADRLWTFERPHPRTEVPVLLRSSEVEAARTALRRAQFSPQPYVLGTSCRPRTRRTLITRSLFTNRRRGRSPRPTKTGRAAWSRF